MPSANQLLFCTAPSIPLFIKVSCQIYTLIAYAYCMACCWMQVASQGLEKVWKKSTSFIARLCNLSYASDVSPQVMKRFDSKKRHFIVMLKLIHPTDRAVMKEPACFLNFHRLSCFLSYPVMTGCISNVHAICDMSFQSVDEENPVWEILYSNRWDMKSPN